MTMDDIRVALSRTGLYYDFEHPDHISADKIESLVPPFMEWGLEDIRIRADGLDYIRYDRLIVRVYTDGTGEVHDAWRDSDGETITDSRESEITLLYDNTDSTRKVEEALEELAGSMQKEITYNYVLGLYETTYTTEV